MTLSRWLLLGLSVAMITGCSDDDDDPTGPSDAGYDFTTILIDYVDDVVVDTYADLRDKADALQTAVAALDAPAPGGGGDQALLDAAGQAWIDAREPWEASEAFLFGPAAFLGLDPALDSWPVDQQQLQDVLESEFELTPEFIAEGLGPALRGYHTIEFLLFRDGQVRTAASVTAREREYLVAATTVFRDEATALWDAWANGYDGGAAFATEMKTAGGTGSRYRTQLDAVTEMLEGMIAICDEVANGKIADPYDEGDTSLVESQFSWNSLTDFANNLRSVRNAYLGGYHLGTDGAGLDVFVASENEALDTRIRSELDAAIAAIGAIPEPFRDNLDASTEIEAAQAAIRTVLESLDEDVRPLLGG